MPGFADELLGKVAEKSRDGTRLLVVDDINDSGGTIEYIRRLLAAVGCEAGNLRFAVLISNSRSKVSVDYWSRTIDRNEDKRWFVFPWEAMGTRDTIKGEALSVPERLASTSSCAVTPGLTRGPAAFQCRRRSGPRLYSRDDECWPAASSASVCCHKGIQLCEVRRLRLIRQKRAR